METIKNKWRLGMLVLFSVVLIACGRDVSTVEDALEGQWTMTNAEMNGEPLVELLVENSEWFDIDESDLTRTEDGQLEMAIDFYYNEGILTIVNSDGDQVETPYEVLSADDEAGTMRLAYTLADEELQVDVEEDITFVGEERESRTSAVNVVDVEIPTTATSEGTELEQQWENLGQEIAREMLQNIEFSFDFDYVPEE